MNTIYLGITVFLLMLAVFDILVGVSNDAVNFINSAIGAKAAKFRTIIIVSSIGVFAGAALSNGMMDIARHGIFTPQHFTFGDVMCIYLAVMVTDVILLDIFNTLGMPTSTTVSMVFELLGGAFALAMLKIVAGGGLGFGDLLNSEKALQVILAIFMSVAVAFVFGWLVQWITRCLFSFKIAQGSRLRQGLFAGLSLTAIVYFLLINGLKGSSLMTPELKSFINTNTAAIVGVCFVAFSLLTTALAFLKVNVLRVVVLCGTFALAMAFTGNDLVNFVGVPLAGLASYQDYISAGAPGIDSFMMDSLQESARTPLPFLLAAGAIMVIALATSKKAQNVVKTSVDLSRQDEGDEMFGSSAMARAIVRYTSTAARAVSAVIPARASRWIATRFNVHDTQIEDGAAFDMLRASVNLVLAGLLVALGTSLKLPLSTTYVTFMVAMGTSLADKAWTRESAVFRVTGVISVIGGWFVTAGVAFCLCFAVATAMHFGGIPVMLLFIAATVFLLIRSNMKYAQKAQKKDAIDDIFKQITRTKQGDFATARELVGEHSRLSYIELLDFVRYEFADMTEAFVGEEYRKLKSCQSRLEEQQKRWKRIRRREIIAMRRIDLLVALEKNTWFFLASNAGEQMLYCMKRISDPCIEHLSNNFTPLSKSKHEPYMELCSRIEALFDQTIDMLKTNDFSQGEDIRAKAEELGRQISVMRKMEINRLTAGSDATNMKNAEIVYINLLQETQTVVGSLRHLIRGIMRLNDTAIVEDAD